MRCCSNTCLEWIWQCGCETTRLVDPRAQRYMGRVIPPFTLVPVCLYSWKSSRSCMQAMWRTCDSHTSQVFSEFRRGTPKVSFPASPSNVVRSSLRSHVHSLTPPVVLRQWSCSSLFLIRKTTSSSEGDIFSASISALLALVRSWI